MLVIRIILYYGILYFKEDGANGAHNKRQSETVESRSEDSGTGGSYRTGARRRVRMFQRASAHGRLSRRLERPDGGSAGGSYPIPRPRPEVWQECSASGSS